jgi:hypothetical protein
MMNFFHLPMALIGLLFASLLAPTAHSMQASDEVTMYADIVEKELIWSAEKSTSPDLQAVYSKSSATWYFFDGANKIEAQRLGTPLKTEGSTVGFPSCSVRIPNLHVFIDCACGHRRQLL